MTILSRLRGPMGATGPCGMTGPRGLPGTDMSDALMYDLKKLRERVETLELDARGAAIPSARCNPADDVLLSSVPPRYRKAVIERDERRAGIFAAGIAEGRALLLAEQAAEKKARRRPFMDLMADTPAYKRLEQHLIAAASIAYENGWQDFAYQTPYGAISL